MTPPTKRSVARRFSGLDFHDDALLSVRVHPPSSLRNSSRIEFDLKDDSTGAIKEISIASCANFQFFMDFDVLQLTGTLGTQKHVLPVITSIDAIVLWRRN